MQLKSTLFGLAVGIVGGATAVLLTTPQSGKDVRLSIAATKNNGLQLNDEFKQRFSTIKESVSAIKNEAQTSIPTLVEDVKASVKVWQQETAPIQNRLKGNIDAMNQTASEFQDAATEISDEMTKLTNRLTFKKNAKA